MSGKSPRIDPPSNKATISHEEASMEDGKGPTKEGNPQEEASCHMADAESSQERPYGQIENDYEDLPCKICKKIGYSGDMWECLGCYEVFHPSCVVTAEEEVNSYDNMWCEWFCSECTSERRYRIKYHRRPKKVVR